MADEPRRGLTAHLGDVGYQPLCGEPGDYKAGPGPLALCEACFARAAAEGEAYRVVVRGAAAEPGPEYEGR